MTFWLVGLISGFFVPARVGVLSYRIRVPTYTVLGHVVKVNTAYATMWPERIGIPTYILSVKSNISILITINRLSV